MREGTKDVLSITNWLSRVKFIDFIIYLKENKI
jgi:hypothetical protein